MALTIRTRRKIFYTLVLLFIVLGGGVVLYAQGWRLDFTTWHFEKIGGIYVRAYPQNAAIYLDGKPIQNQSGFLSPGTLISDLLPAAYSVVLKAAGYDEWQENATVQPSLVIQYKYAVLVPENGVPAASSTVRQLLAASPSATSTMATASAILADASTAASTTFSGKNVEAQWITSSLAGILQNNGEFYLYDANAQSVSKLADDGKYFAATDDGSMLAVLEADSLEVFSLADSSMYYRFNLPNIADAARIIWYKDRTHLFIVYPDHVSFLDLADSGLTNFTTVGQGTSPLYDPQSNALFVTTPEKTIVEYDFPN